jgi:hypothetical protein
MLAHGTVDRDILVGDLASASERRPVALSWPQR